MVCVYIHFKLGKAAEPCFKMIGHGVGIYVGDKDKGCSFFPGPLSLSTKKTTAKESRVSTRYAPL
jgi:hypothetical protein